MKKRQRQEHEQKNGSVALSSTVDVSSGNLSSSNANGKQHRPVTNEDWAGGSLTASGCGPANLCREGNKEICTGGAKRWLLPTTLLPASCWRPLSVKPFGWSALGAVLAVLVLLTLPNTAEAGKCVDTPKGSTAFCQISYQVYVSADTMANDTAYWFDLDKKAETLTEEWNKNMGCSQSVLASEAWCKNYACSLNFPKCGSFKDAPLPICRQTCVDCFRTCTPDRPILPPGIYYQPDGTERTWEKQYTQTQYDAWSKAYICEADHKLVDGGRFLLFTIGTPCTGTGTKLVSSLLSSMLLSVSALLFHEGA